jgi:1-acyl-sn-glycerol-3-phosphate acyltransferase
MLAAVRTLIALVTVSVYILILGPPVLLWAALSGDRRLLFAAGTLALQLGLALSGIRVQLAGAEHLQRGTPAIYVGNHSSNLDPPVVFVALRALTPRLRTLYKAELRRLPLIVWVFDLAGFVPLERRNPEQSLPAVDHAVAALKAGNSFFIFPEGTRSRTGELLPFKKGGFVMAIAAGAPIVPMAVSGGRAAMRKGSPIIHPATVTVRLGPPIPTTGLTFDDRNTLVDRVHAAVQTLLHT